MNSLIILRFSGGGRTGWRCNTQRGSVVWSRPLHTGSGQHLRGSQKFLSPTSCTSPITFQGSDDITHATMGVRWPPWKKGWKIKKRKHAKNSSFLCLCYILRAVFYVYVIFWEQSGQAGVENGAMLTILFIQIYFRMHHFVVKFSKFSSPQTAREHWPLTKILRTFLHATRAQQTKHILILWPCILYCDLDIRTLPG